MRYKNKRTLQRKILLCLIMGGISALASEPELADTLRIGLQDAILLGLKNNPTVAVKRLEPKIMETYVKEQKGFFDPALEISGTQSQNKSQRLLGTRPTPVELQDNRSNYSLQISVNLYPEP